ncbi:helix-turn-helix domain-containing protein [bacterium]|nr:helix-turn-helix domain-containing protein [bacterium]
MSQKEQPEYLTLKQACELLQVHPNTLRNWDKNGTLKAIRIGGRKIYRYKKADLIKFMETK